VLGGFAVGADGLDGLTDPRAGPSAARIIRGRGLHRPRASGYLTDMLVVRADGFVDPCIPFRAPKPASGPDWVHEIKHDGYRLIVRQGRDRALVHPPRL
jgi:hypothetical protein